MPTDETLDGLRYKSEGTDLDFKQTQYRFVKATEADKAELLKDILAMANAWRDGPGYILLGFKDRAPHPAEVVGIVEHLDDANIQQFVHGKVKPKLEFYYEERIYESKTVGIITIPKQTRAFYIANAYGHLKSNVVYVRRGSSTDEAEPPEIAKMIIADSGRGTTTVQLSILNSENESLADSVTLRFLKFEALPDYASKRSNDPYGLQSSIYHDNRNFWREAAAYLVVKLSLIQVQFELTNRSNFALSNAKLEISLEALDGQRIKMLAADDLPDEPRNQWSAISNVRGLAAKSRHDQKFVVDESGSVPLCHARLGTLLPGETARAVDSLAVHPSGPGRIKLYVRVLAEELATPIEHDRLIEAMGNVETHDLEGLRRVISGNG